MDMGTSNRTAYVYFINQVGTNLYKVGWSHSPYARLAHLQIGNPHKLQLVATIEIPCECSSELQRECGEPLELHLHTRLLNGYLHLQKHERGEWFWIQADWLNTLLFEIGLRDKEMLPHLSIGEVNRLAR